jgi:hypothetical protein
VAGGVDDERDAGRSGPGKKRNFLSIKHQPYARNESAPPTDFDYRKALHALRGESHPISRRTRLKDKPKSKGSEKTAPEMQVTAGAVEFMATFRVALNPQPYTSGRAFYHLIAPFFTWPGMACVALIIDAFPYKDSMVWPCAAEKRKF